MNRQCGSCGQTRRSRIVPKGSRTAGDVERGGQASARTENPESQLLVQRAGGMARIIVDFYPYRKLDGESILFVEWSRQDDTSGSPSTSMARYRLGGDRDRQVSGDC